jgi:hypothetical protein
MASIDRANTLVVDLETYYAADYKIGDSIADYVADPRFEITALGIGIGLSPANPYLSLGPSVPLGLAFLNHYCQEHSPAIVMHNARFDATILRNHSGVRFPVIWDTLAMARAIFPRESNSLAAVAERLGLKAKKGDTSQFLGYSYRPCNSLFPPTPGEEERLREYLAGDVMLTRQIFDCLVGEFSDDELSLINHTAQLWLNPRLVFDYTLYDSLMRELEADRDTAVGAYADLELSREVVIRKELTRALAAAGDTLAPYEKTTKDGRRVVALAKTDPQRRVLESHANVEVSQIIGAKIGAESFESHANRLERMKRVADFMGGLMPVPLRYAGAHTGRFSGEEQINLQNLGSRGDSVITKFKGLLKAPPGHSLILADYATIEARGAAWLAGEESQLRIFADSKRDIYCEFAAIASGKQIRKPIDTDSPEVAADLKWWRAAGKIVVLGSQYAAGPGALLKQSAGNFDLPMATKLVAAYRSLYPAIPRCWHTLERNFMACLTYGNSYAIPGGTIQRGKRSLTYPGQSETYRQVQITLLSGRKLNYFARLEEGGILLMNPKERADSRGHGGYLLENLTQALSRDILTHTILRSEEAGFPVCLHCHDSVVYIVPTEMVADDKSRAETLDKLRKIGEAGPAWAAGWPLRLEFEIAERYQ